MNTKFWLFALLVALFFCSQLIASDVETAHEAEFDEAEYLDNERLLRLLDARFAGRRRNIIPSQELLLEEQRIRIRRRNEQAFIFLILGFCFIKIFFSFLKIADYE